MFVCRILVGDYTKGESSYLRPPSKDGGDTVFYHSCVNDLFDPSIFVVFEKHQIYPEYLLEYSDSSGFDSPNRPAVARPTAAVRHVTPSHTSYYKSSTAASSSFSSPSYTSSSSSTSYYKPPTAASSFVSSFNTSSSRASPSQSSTTPKPSKSECIIS